MPPSEHDDDSLGPRRNPRTAISWITSLAITVTCCAIQFIIFAGYILDVKEDIAAQKERFNILEKRLNVVETQFDALRQRSNVQQIQILPPPNGAPVQLPISLMPDAVPAGTAMPLSTSAPALSPPVTNPERH